MDSPGKPRRHTLFRGGPFLLIHPIGEVDAKHANRDAAFPGRQTDMSAHIRRPHALEWARTLVVLSVHRLQADRRIWGDTEGFMYIHFVVPYLSVVRCSPRPNKEIEAAGR